MTQVSDPPRRRQSMAIALTVLVGLSATAVAYLGSRENPQAPVSSSAALVVDTALPQMIVLPHDDPEWPPGPHQRTFIASCTICHSTRLVMTQPSFPRSKWIEIVHKMVKTYGAPIAPEREAQVVDYLMTVRGE